MDFCAKCHAELEVLFTGRDLEHVCWVVRFVTAVASHLLLNISAPLRERVAQAFAFNWPT